MDSYVIFKHGFVFKFNKNSFNFKWEWLTAVPTISKLSTLEQCLFSWQCFLIVVASFSVYFIAFSVWTDKAKCSYWRTNRCRLVLPMKTLLQVSHLNLYKTFELMCLGNMSLRRKDDFTFVDELNFFLTRSKNFL